MRPDHRLCFCQDLDIEESLVYQLLGYINEFKEQQVKEADLKEADALVTFSVADFVNYTPPQTISQLFFVFLQLQPMAFRVSFHANPELRQEADALRFNPLSLVIGLVG